MYTHGKFGIEYTPSEPKPENSWLGRVIFIVALVAIALVIRAIWVRISSTQDKVEDEVKVEDSRLNNEKSDFHCSSSNLQASTSSPSLNLKPNYSNRPLKVRNLLLRLAEAERLRDIEMQISTIEQLRATPNVADLDDMLARKLGTLNCKRLFELKSAQWVVKVKVKRGDSATRIAYEHGSTYASLIKLNGGNLDKIKVNQPLMVMNHPRFNLVISRRTRTADLILNGKFFKRYYLTSEVKGAEGSYETPERFRNFCTSMGIPFKPLDRAELEMLLPKGTAAFIKEI